MMVLRPKIKNSREEKDWIIIRLLFLLLQTPSNVHLRDVNRTIDYLKQTREDLWKDMTLINHEHAVNQTFDAPDVELARNITKTVQQTLTDLAVKND
jgi:hypothetical protein